MSHLTIDINLPIVRRHRTSRDDAGDTLYQELLRMARQFIGAGRSEAAYFPRANEIVASGALGSGQLPRSRQLAIVRQAWRTALSHARDAFPNVLHAQEGPVPDAGGLSGGGEVNA